MTLQEAKDQIKAKYNVDDLFRKELDEAAELYARSKWDEACGAQRFYVQEYLSMRRHNVFVDNIAKPEFKP